MFDILLIQVIKETTFKFRFCFSELEPLNKDAQEKQLDFRELHSATKDAEFKSNNDDNDWASSDDDDNKRTSCFHIIQNRKKKSESDFKPAPKMNTFVGFLRLANYVNACCVIFGVILSIFLQDLIQENEQGKEKRETGQSSQ